MSQTGIYKITNTLNGNLYVGSAVDFSSRRRLHLYHLRHGTHHSSHLQRAFNKYGEDVFVFEFMEAVPKERASLLDRETYWIRTLRPKYNGTMNTATNLGIKYSEETKQKFREAQRRPEVIARKRAALLGRPASEETKQLLAYYRSIITPEQRKGMAGRHHSEATLLRMRDAITEEARRQRAESMKAAWAERSEEERQRIVDASHSEEARRKRSESLKVAWQDEEHHRAVTEKVREAWQDEELRSTQSETMRAMWAERSEEERRAYIEPTLTEEARRNRAKASQATWDSRSEEDRQRHTAHLQSEASRRKRGETMRASWTEEDRQQRSEESRAMWAERSEEERRQATSALRNPEVNRRRAETLREVWRKKKEAKAAAQQDSLSDTPDNNVSH